MGGDAMSRLAPLLSSAVLLALGLLGDGGSASAQPNAVVDIGQVAPGFTLLDTSARPVRLSDFEGARIVLVQFQPGDVLQVCDGDLVTRRDGYAEFREAGAQVLTITVDRPAALGRAREVLGLPFPLLSDETRETSRRYGVLPGRPSWWAICSLRPSWPSTSDVSTQGSPSGRSLPGPVYSRTTCGGVGVWGKARMSEVKHA
jgi:peroxiredoxin